ncbi:unnamed protein product [Candidula unifasciata]|uniref:Carboxylic ester hydrolase n=1 Tax=Candidula unifasciata TaxID=100452 RepID=A0A8S3ZNK4_9EUPU|nr:unnamed protein product [Candidula unifasciata]
MIGVYSCLFLCWVTQCIPCTSSANDPNGVVVVSLRPGQQLRGLNNTSAFGQTVYTFYGVPYAAPPTGGRRFRPPEPAPDWTGIRDAITESSICPQGSVRTEDCLYLNVFTPDVNATLPVFVWIHGGGFMIGSAYADGDGATIAPQGVVAVTINYRLGPFGFLSTGDDIMPGNYGMLDQILALKWVQKYIRAFGGDPGQVTIGGQSAGAHSVSFMIISPLAKGLFHRGIMESGSSLALTALERPGTKEQVRETSLELAARVGCNQSLSSSILQCLQRVDVNDLMDANKNFAPMPRIETTFGFIPEEPLILIQKGNYNKVDTLHGTNSGEWTGSFPESNNISVVKQEFVNIMKSQLKYFIKADAMTSLMTDAYTTNVTDAFTLEKMIVHAVADIKYGGATIVETSKYVTTGDNRTNHFLYEFDYRISGTTTPAWRGVVHGAERCFVFYPDVRYNYSTADDRAMGQAVQTMWANFIKYGDPTPSGVSVMLNSGNNTVKWNKFTNTTPNMLKIDEPSKLVTYPRLFLVSLYERILQLMKSASRSTNFRYKS